MSDGVNLVWNLATCNLTEGDFLDQARENGRTHLAVGSWKTGEPLPDTGAVATFTGDHEAKAVYELDGAWAYVSIDHEHVYELVSADTAVTAAEGLNRVRELLPAGDSSRPDQVAVTFWANNPRGPMQIRRNLDAPTWDDITANYTRATREQLERLMFSFTPGRGGQLILWAGKPGTGKTTAVRALAREWRDWAEVHYITDPDKFFGAEADYMLSVLLDESVPISYSPDDGTPPPERWRILLLEDAGELLQADARERTGQGLSRFLNAVDGLIGQGLRVLVLVTTNEDVRKLNPAVARPGRCAANVDFGMLDGVEANEWLDAHGGGERPAGQAMATLADLFAIVEGYEGEGATRPLGFTTEATA